MKIIIFVLIIAFLAACSNRKKDTNQEQVTRSIDIDIPEPDILDRLTYQKNNLDSLIGNSKLIEKSFCKLVDKDELFAMSIGSISDTMEVEKLYNIWKTADGKIVVVGEYPYSQSGDWTSSCVHYFDKKGLTFALETSSTYFIEEGIATESTIEYYNANFIKEDSIYSLIDDHKTKLDENKFGHRYNHKYEKYGNVKTLLKSIELSYK